MALVSLETNAQTVFRSLGDVWKYADDHNITIRSAQYDLKKAGYTKKSAYGAFLPQIAATGSATENTALQTTLIPAEMLGGPAGVYRAVQFGQKYIYSGGYTAQLDIINIQSWMNLKIAKEGEAMSKDSLANNRKTVYQQLATQYYNYLLMKEAATLAGQSWSVADSVAISVAGKYKEGLVNEANVDLSKMNAQRAKQTYITSQYQMLTAANNLKGLLDMDVHDSLQITDLLHDNIELPKDEVFQEDPTVKLAMHQANISLYQSKMVNSNFLPNLSLLYSNTSQQNDNKYEPFQSGGPSWYPATYWSLRASWQLFNGGSRYFQSKKSRVGYEQKAMLCENMKKQAGINDENLRLAYKKAVEMLANTKGVMTLSYDNYLHTTYRYKEGLGTIDDRLNAFSDYINYQNQYLNSLSDMLVQLYLIKIRQLDFK